MDRLWAPWRLEYAASPKTPAVETGCFICRGVAENRDRENWIVQRSERSVTILNRYPYNNGHLLVCPLSHKGELHELDAAESLELQQTLSSMIQILRKLLNPDGFNVGLNLGRTAGAGVPGHLHWHVVPRWQGDSNFMPVLADTRVIVQSLDALYDALTRTL